MIKILKLIKYDKNKFFADKLHFTLEFNASDMWLSITKAKNKNQKLIVNIISPIKGS